VAESAVVMFDSVFDVVFDSVVDSISITSSAWVNSCTSLFTVKVVPSMIGTLISTWACDTNPKEKKKTKVKKKLVLFIFIVSDYVLVFFASF
jgi:hypothetical protein